MIIDYKNPIIERLYNKDIIVASNEMIQIYLKAQKIAKTDSSVLILGESGVGKDLLAKYIHEESSKKSGLFVHINCSAIPSNLFVSEMFGYTPGSFTDAQSKGKIGLLESANNGTLFLDEIGDLALENQIVLLDFLQRKCIKAIGTEKERKIDVRVISATSKNLNVMIDNGSFRKDLYYRLSVINFEIPPLRQRKDDISALIKYFADSLCNNFERKKLLSDDAVDFLSMLDWCGNIRELQNKITQIYYMEDNELITRNHIEGKYKFSAIDNVNLPKSTTLKEAVEEFECKYISKVILNTNNLKEAANQLGISIATLYRKIQQLGIKHN